MTEEIARFSVGIAVEVERLDPKPLGSMPFDPAS
jgi:hypothetical protein